MDRRRVAVGFAVVVVVAFLIIIIGKISINIVARGERHLGQVFDVEAEVSDVEALHVGLHRLQFRPSVGFPAPIRRC